MSFPALSWAVRQKLPSTQKLVLLMLAERHNKDSGQCNPSLELLADDCGLSRRSVIDQIAKLQQAGYLTVRHRAKESLRLPSQYVLHLGFGVPEQVQNTPHDPYLMPEKVVNDVHLGGERAALGSERAAPPQCKTFTGVVNVLHEGSEPVAHKPGIEPGIEPVNTNSARATAAPAAPTIPPAPPAPPAPPVATIAGVPEDLVSEWKQVRKAKRAGPISQTVIDAIYREAAKAGITPEQAIRCCVERGWQGFKADWYSNAATAGRTGSPAPAPHKYAAAARAIFSSQSPEVIDV